MLSQVRPALFVTLFFTVLLGLVYPLAVTGLAQLAFPVQANGSLVRDGAGRVIGSRLLAQGFSRPEYLHSRLSAAGPDGYDAQGSSGSNLGPLNPALAERVRGTAVGLRAAAPGDAIPDDALTASGSGLDPHISPANARMQVERIAAARGVSVAEVRRLVDRNVSPPTLGFLGQPTVNVLETNLALDAAFAGSEPATR